MGRNTTIALAILLPLLILGFAGTFVVDETEVAIVTQFGKFKRSVEKPGLYYKLPFVQTVHRMERRILASDAPPAEYLTNDKKRMVTDPITRWRIVDPLKFFMTVHDEAGARARLDDIVGSEMRREIATFVFDKIVGKERVIMMQTVTKRVNEKTEREFGIKVIDVEIKRADLPREVQDSVFARMRAERERIAKRYRSEGEEEAAKIRASTQKEKRILLAEAYEKAQTLKGDGDAESTKIYAESFGKDPEFYSFVRSLKAYEKVLNGDTTLVLSTRSALFKYLSTPGASK